MAKEIKVYVVTDPQEGWDCVRGVYTNLKAAVERCGGEYIEGQEYYSYDFNSEYVIFERDLKDKYKL